jgi:hypothetical protein
VLTPTALIIIIATLGKLPDAPEHDIGKSKIHTGHIRIQPPTKVIVFSSAVLIGIAMNITSVLPGLRMLAESSSANYSMVQLLVGGVLGLAVFTRFPVNFLWHAYMLHALVMASGNIALIVACNTQTRILFGLSRIGIGFQCGCMYNVGLALVYCSQGFRLSTSLLVAQLCISIGFLLGPALGAGSALIGHAFGHVAEVEILLPITLMSM